MAKKTVANKTTGKQAAKTPAEVLREQKAKIADALKEGHRIPRPGAVDPVLDDAIKQSAEARDAIGSIVVPITLAKACLLIGGNVEPENFATTAFSAIARDIETLSDLAEHESEESGFYGWLVLQQLAERARFAGEVAALLEAEAVKS
jgi:hypothetical protein